MYLSFESKNNSLRQSADSQSTKYSVSEHMVDPVQTFCKRPSDICCILTIATTFFWLVHFSMPKYQITIFNSLGSGKDTLALLEQINDHRAYTSTRFTTLRISRLFVKNMQQLYLGLP